MSVVQPPKLLVFASGTSKGGGSGFRELVENVCTGVVSAEIPVVICNHENGGVRKIADEYGVPFHFFQTGSDNVDRKYKHLLRKYKPDFVALSGWLQLTSGLDPATAFNIHPGPLPKFGGKGMYGHHVHEAVIEAGERQSAVTMHFVTEKYDEGPSFFVYPVKVRKGETPEELAGRVNKIEHGWQSLITELVLRGDIRWSGKKGDPVLVTPAYKRMPFCPETCQVITGSAALV